MLRVTRRVDDELTHRGSDLSLLEINGIGSKRAQLLATAGVKNISDLADSSILILSSKTGISKKLLSKWITRAKKFNT